MGVKCAAVNKILFCILLFVLFSCKNENHKVDRGEIFIANLDSTCTSEFKYSDLYKKVTAIILDNKEVMLTEISKMLVYKDKLYLLDRRAQGVYAFCKDGSFVCKFGNLGAGPDEYVSCNDFGINADAGEIYIYDMAKHRIHKYDIFSASYKESIIIDKSIDIDYIMCNSGCLYAAQASNRNEEKESIYYLLYQIDVKSGKKIAQWFDAVYYNKGWNDELIHGNIFYNIRENKDLFVLGLMDTIMCIKGDAVFPFLAIESERLVQKEDYKRITPDVLRKFYDRYYHSRNCTIYVSGKVGDDCVRRIEDLFGREAFGKGFQKPEKTDFIPVSSVDKRIFVEYADVMQSAVRMGMLSLERCHPDYLKARVMVTLFGGYFGSRLMSNIREEKGYTYGISAGIAPYPGQGILVINTETANEFVEPLVREVYHEIDRLQNDPVPEDELFMVKNYMLGEMCRSYESAFSLADAWMFVQVSGFGDTHFEDALNTIKNITPEEIRELAGRYLCKEKLKEVISGKKMS